MTEQPTDPAAVEVWARMLCAADAHVYGGDHPNWQQLGTLSRKLQDDYRKAARWLLPRLTVGRPDAAPPAPAGEFRRDRYAAAIAKRDGHEWPTEFEDDERDYRRRADAAIAVADAERAAAPSAPADRAERRERYAAAIRAESSRVDDVALAEAVMAVADVEHAAEIAHLRSLLATENKRANDAIDREETANRAAEEAVERGRRLALAFEVSGNEFIADQIRGALSAPRPEFDVQAGLQHLTDDLHRGEESGDVPAPGGRAAVLLEAAEELVEDDHLLAAAELRRMADEAQQAEPVAPSTRCARCSHLRSVHAVDTNACIVVIGVPGNTCTCPEFTTEEQPGEAQQAQPRQACVCGQPRDYCDVDGVAADRVLAERLAAAKAQPEVFGPEVVAYRHPTKPRSYLCRQHGDGQPGLTPVEADDLEHGGGCDECGGDVLARQTGEAGRG